MGLALLAAFAALAGIQDWTEPNDSFDDATQVSLYPDLNVVTALSIDSENDADVFKIEAHGHLWYELWTVSSIDTRMRVFDSDQNQIAFNDDPGMAIKQLGGNLNAHIWFRAPETGTYYILVGGVGTAVGPYELKVDAPYVPGTVSDSASTPRGCGCTGAEWLLTLGLLRFRRLIGRARAGRRAVDRRAR